MSINNQHPRPELIGTLKFPEYLDGGCVSYAYAEKMETFIAMQNPPTISRSIALKNVNSESDFWNQIKQILDPSKKWIIDSYSKSVEGSNVMFILIPVSDWSSIDYDSKYRLITEMINQIKNSEQDLAAELYIYTCENPGSKWVAYAKANKQETLVRFDWGRSILEEFLDSINPFNDTDPV